MKQNTSFSQAHRGFVAVALASLTATLVGCSGEPSAGDIDKTVRSYMSESQTQLQKLSGTKNSLGEIHNVKKLGCKSDTDASWRCDVELDVTQFQNRTKGPASFRFIKGSDGWTLAR
ncbi:hypothetical protein NU688_32375 [Variovorax sp. ZS18.2.2]|uniref:hypothetical protein n=1 Tax=Variovorax sp. ZS18.2.2 TaxID=2971255 RepID=UPI0021517C6B|nr:hypothetical protein [Variovorax sp. ZS18.2.2]MCR6480892.1 hypothetical protein [Variovorax sp. ZS18.2.2]